MYLSCVGGCEFHSLSLSSEGHDQCQLNTQPLAGSPDSHYYHVLEPPGYNSSIWLANSETRGLLSQNQNNCKLSCYVNSFSYE